jgi:hypothetical protein
MNRVIHAATRGERTDTDLIMHLSARARETRRPGQTLQQRMSELRREVGYV